MTQKTVIQCDWRKGDGDPCDEETPTGEEIGLPPEWSEFNDGNGNQWHLCPKHGHDAFTWSIQGESKGDDFETVAHNYVDPEGMIEEAFVHGDTLSMSIYPQVNDPASAEKFPEYDFDETEGYGFHVDDHLHVYVFGGHKQEPHVIIDSDEFPTSLEIRDSEGSFTDVETAGGVL